MNRKEIVNRRLFLGLALLAICAAAAGVWLGLASLHAEPVLLKSPEDAREQVVHMLDMVCDGDFDGAGAFMLGNPALGADALITEKTGAMLWDAFIGSISYELDGACYATDSGVAQDVQFTALAFDSVTDTLRQRTQELLQQRLEEAEDVSQIYDENNNFREDVVKDALTEALEAALQEDAICQTKHITVHLIYADGKWQIVADKALLEAISGGILN